MMKERYEDEIEQILRELDTQPPGEGTPPPAAQHPVTPVDDEPSPFAPKPPTRKRLISPTKLSIVGLVLALAGLLVTHIAWMMIAGLAVVAVAVAWMFIQRASNQNAQVWRGRAVDPPPQTMWQRFRRWLSK